MAGAYARQRLKAEMKENVPSSDTRETPSASGCVSCAVVCPMCALAGVQYRLNPRQFWNTNREVDLQPTGYRFRGQEGVHPPLLAMWHCSGCYFTAEAGDFQNPLEGVLIRPETVAFALKERMRTDVGFRRVVDMLRAGIRLESANFVQAFKLHLLAFKIWDAIGAMVKQDYLKQAKYSLLLAWLYRDLQTADPARAQTVAQLELLHATLQRDWPDVPKTETAALQKAVTYYDESLSISTFAKDPMNEIMTHHRIGRIQMKMGQFVAARDIFRKNTILAQAIAVQARQQLANRGSLPGREEVTGAAREALVDRQRKLESLMVDESRLADTLRAALAAQAPKPR